MIELGVHLDADLLAEIPAEVLRRGGVELGQALRVHSGGVAPRAADLGVQDHVAGPVHVIAPEDSVPLLLLLGIVRQGRLLGGVAEVGVGMLLLAAGQDPLRLLGLDRAGLLRLGEALRRMDVADRHEPPAGQPAVLIIAFGNVQVLGILLLVTGEHLLHLITALAVYMDSRSGGHTGVPAGGSLLAQGCGDRLIHDVHNGLRLPLLLAAGQGLLPAGVHMLVAGDGIALRQEADQLPLLHGLGGGIALLPMDVCGIIGNTADQLTGDGLGRDLIAGVGVPVPLAGGDLLLAADQGLRIAGVAVVVDDGLRRGDHGVRAGDSPLRRALLAADQDRLLRIAALVMDMEGEPGGERANHDSPVQEALIPVGVQHEIRVLLPRRGNLIDALHRALGLRRRLGGHLRRPRALLRQGGVAALVVDVLLLSAGDRPRPGKRRQDQGVDRAEHDHSAHPADDLPPGLSFPQIGKIFCRPAQVILFHTRFSFPKPLPAQILQTLHHSIVVSRDVLSPVKIRRTRKTATPGRPAAPRCRRWPHSQ